MAAIPPLIIAAAIGAVATVGSVALSSALAPKPPKPISPAAQMTTRSSALDRAASNDILSRRKGTDADRRVGFGAGEAFTGPRRSLLGRS